MSPSATASRPVWVWSLPAVAILISYFWFRKKRDSLQTDTGGSREKCCALTETPTAVPQPPTPIPTVSAPTTPIPSVSAPTESVVDNNNGIPKEPETVKTLAVEQLPKDPVVEEDAKVTEDVEAVITKSKATEVEAEAVTTDVEGESTLAATADVTIDAVVSDLKRIAEEEAKKDVVLESVKVEAEEVVIVEVTQGVEVETTQVTIADVPSAADAATQEEVATTKDSPAASVDVTPSLKASKKKRSRKSLTLADSVMASDSGAASAEPALDGQMANLKVEEKTVESSSDSKTLEEGERDSANNSPSEVMLASPSLSAYSDTHSEGSSDSGKGCSEVLTPSPTPISGNSVSGDAPAICIYEFAIPQHLVGRLIGRNGSYIHEIKDNTHATVYIRRYPDTTKLKICAIEGTQVDIDSALDMIRHKFPKKRYPNVTLEPLELTHEIPPAILPDNIHLYLVEGINNDVILSSLVSAGHYFLQQPTHPTYLSLNRLNSCMTACYAEPNLPALPEGIEGGVLCAAPVNNGWYRAEVVSYPEGDECNIKFVDYGGYMPIQKSSLRQIRADFITLPFQAAECLLAAVRPIGEDGLWTEEAKEFVEKLTLGKVLQAQVHGYTELSIPLIYLFTVYNNEVVSINDELVAHGFAEYLLPTPVTEDCGGFVEVASPAPVAV